MNGFPNINMKQAITAVLIVIAFGLFSLGLTFVIPVLGVLVALGIIAALIYLVYLFLTGKI
jgi:hypothetical protein